MPAKGKRQSGQATTAAANGAQADVVFTVPQGKSWVFDTVSVAVDAGVNTVRILHGTQQIWDDLTNVTTEQQVDLVSRYPRALQAEAGETITVRVITNEAIAKTLTAKVWPVEY